MLKLLRQLAAPDRHPWPRVTRMDIPHEDDDPEVKLRKIEYLEQQAAEGQRALAWRAQVQGWHQALIVFALTNAMLLVACWWRPITGEQYGLIMVLLFVFMSFFSKRLIR